MLALFSSEFFWKVKVLFTTHRARMAAMAELIAATVCRIVL